jgi:hypothetical protein
VTANNRSYYYVTGPVNLYVRVTNFGFNSDETLANYFARASATKAYFLGFCEEFPKPQIGPQWQPFFSSEGGSLIPADEIYQGSQVKLTLPSVSKFDEDLLQLLTNSPTFGRRGLPPGTESYLDRGLLKIANGCSFEFWARNAFWGTENSRAYPDMPIGTYFPCCTIGQIARDGEGRSSNVKFSCDILPSWVKSNATGNSVCYTSDPQYFTNLPDAF